MKKTTLFLVTIALLFSACTTSGVETVESAAETSTPKPAQTKAKPTEAASRLNVNEEALRGVEIKVWTPWYGTEQSLFESFVNEFNSTNPWGIKAAAETQINFTNLYEVTTASLPTEEKPNLVIALPEHAQEWYAEGVTTDLTDYVNDPLFGIDSSDFSFAIWNQDVAGSARVAIPAQRTANVLLWNETWANELKIKSAPASPEDFRKQVCRAHDSMKKDAFTENDAMGGWLVNADAMTVYSWMLAFGGNVIEETDYRFLTPDNIETFKFLRELAEAGCSWQGAADPIESFAKREALLVTVNLHDLPLVARAFVSAENRDTWQVLPFPEKDDGVLVLYGSSYVILNSTDEEQLATWLFVKWLLEKEQDARWVQTTHLFPLRTSTLELLDNYERSHPQWRQAVDLLKVGELQPPLASWRTVKVMLEDGFTHMYRVNVSSGQVAAILAQMESTAKELSK